MHLIEVLEPHSALDAAQRETLAIMVVVVMVVMVVMVSTVKLQCFDLAHDANDRSMHHSEVECSCFTTQVFALKPQYTHECAQQVQNIVRIVKRILHTLYMHHPMNRNTVLKHSLVVEDAEALGLVGEW